jgi:hypothetical protein
VVDIIIKHMSYIKINNSEDFKQILPELTDIQSFGDYLSNLLTETQQMQDKRVLRIKEPLNNRIIAMASSHTAFIDDKFYKESFFENKRNLNYKAFPVEIVSLKINWIISTPEGKEFL